MVRVKLWTPSGRIVYSDESRLVGADFPLEPGAAQTLADTRISAGISDLGRPENRYERDDGKLLEVYDQCGRRTGSRCCSRPTSKSSSGCRPGLEYLQQAIDVQRRGVSAAKVVVVTLAPTAPEVVE